MSVFNVNVVAQSDSVLESDCSIIFLGLGLGAYYRLMTLSRVSSYSETVCFRLQFTGRLVIYFLNSLLTCCTYSIIVCCYSLVLWAMAVSTLVD